jgi:hypothetical protein
MFDNLRTICQKISFSIWRNTHTEFQDEMGHLYSVSIFSFEYLQDGFKIGGLFRRNFFSLRRQNVSDLTDDCPF